MCRRMSYCALIVCDVVALILTENGAMRLNPTWFHLFPLHLARGPWRAAQQFIPTQTKKPLRLPSPQSDVHIVRYPPAGGDLIKHPVWVSCQLLAVASLGAIPTVIVSGSTFQAFFEQSLLKTDVNQRRHRLLRTAHSLDV